ncbi:hypothetical protein GCM10007094_27000 [Pseudovibrio japonicus]|uniref:Pole-organizing protein PopZ n=1 Tax=Pseudovibrio japonicus TaxID=366534 RepID=A0ABQ3EIG0_9HYPH|nr:DUF2497 domain-containing protein [Pseudovibrio japonicus]GHB35997.1 hypothetical protein GCM10007094_27000 [Pseudovibrio japonicus]
MGAVSQGNEPSMEDILSSIRKIISDDEASGAKQMTDDVLSEADANRELSQDDLDKLFDDAPAALEPAPAPEPEEAKEAEREVLELTQKEKIDEQSSPVKMVEGLAEKADGGDGDVAFIDPLGPEAFGLSSAEQDDILEPANAQDPMETLISSTTDQVVSSAFNGLANTVLSKNARTLEDLVAEMLRPMLKGWLDQHLPGVVERLVRQEIDRISRK